MLDGCGELQAQSAFCPVKGARFEQLAEWAPKQFKARAIRLGGFAEDMKGPWGERGVWG